MTEGQLTKKKLFQLACLLACWSACWLASGKGFFLVIKRFFFSNPGLPAAKVLKKNLFTTKKKPFPACLLACLLADFRADRYTPGLPAAKVLKKNLFTTNKKPFPACLLACRLAGQLAGWLPEKVFFSHKKVFFLAILKRFF